jgi:drug/metabolite transporter (DMT)-like permease
MLKKIHYFSPLILLVLLGFIWGTGYSIARFAMTNGVNPLGYSFWQSIGPAIILGLIALTKERPNTPAFKSTWRYYLICGLTGIVIPNTNMYYAASHLPAGLLAVIVNTVPLIAYLLALLNRIENFNWLRLAAVGLGACGLMLILLPAANVSTTTLPWLVFAMLTPLSFAFCAIYISRHQPKDCGSLTAAAGTLIFSSILLTPLVAGSGNFYALNWPLTLADKVILLEIVLSTLGYILFFKLLKTAGPVYYSFVDTIVALTGLFWGYIIFGEQMTMMTAMGVTLILVALVIVNKRVVSMLEYSTVA